MSVEDGIPETGQATPEPTHDWERDYKALQAEYTRSQQDLKAWEDEQTAVQRFAEKFPHLMAQDDEEDTEEPYEPDTPVNDPRVDQHEKQIQQFAQWQAEQQYAADLKQVAGDHELSAHAKRTIKSWTAEGGNNRAALEASVKEWLELEESLRGPQRKSAPTPPQPGKAAEVDRNASKDPAARRAARRAQIAAQLEAGQQ